MISQSCREGAQNVKCGCYIGCRVMSIVQFHPDPAATISNLQEVISASDANASRLMKSVSM